MTMNPWQMLTTAAASVSSLTRFNGFASEVAIEEIATSSRLAETHRSELRCMVLSGWTRLVTLCGPDAAARSEMATEAARTMASEFADGVVLLSIATAASPASIGHKRCLVIVDGDDSPDAAVAIEALLTACPRLSVIVTREEPLGVRGEYKVAVGSGSGQALAVSLAPV